jgi:SAM-dependent methyltransferase
MSRRECAPAAERNRGPILDVLRRVLPARGLVLEIAAGTGQHAAWFAAALPELTWQPTDADAGVLGSIAAWCQKLPNVAAPLQLDVTADVWPVVRADAIVCANLIHIAPWASCEGLMRGAGRVLPRNGVLCLYGPYRIGGAHTAPSNETFDQSLRARDRRWGVRDLEAVVREAARHELVLEERVAMPANNQSLIFVRPSARHAARHDA